MNISSANSSILYAAALSSIRSSSKQQELALQLITSTVQGLLDTTGAQAPAQPVAGTPSVSPTDTGQFIDIRV